MLERDPNNTAAQFSVEFAKLKVSYCLQASDPLAAIHLARDSLGMLDQMIASNRGGPAAVSDQAEALMRLGQAQLKADRLKEARSSADSALAAMRKIAVQGPEDRNNVVQALILVGRTNAASGNLARAESLLREARDKAQSMVRPEELTSLTPLPRLNKPSGPFMLPSIILKRRAPGTNGW